MRPRPKKIFEAEATMYEVEARHVREQLSVYEHEDQDMGVWKFSVSNQYTTEMIVDGYVENINQCHVHCEYTRPISMRPDAMRPRPERVRQMPNDLASRPTSLDGSCAKHLTV